ncbi:ADP-ribosylation factor-binding protein GGA1-like isoform X2 [Liolophura sinensis]|uniref:ADP-ribosylation factor-binding protein GGA1-like isoform X2 n=1 Tax=Liolophura sinensis TaxID=3198878 RepID=UPI003158A197
MADVGEESLESLLNKATNPANREEDWEFIISFCDQVNKELEGPQIAIRLLAHKIQSPQEREALYALSTVESCVKNCGRRFHQEVGKFRFLNEMIKVVSPKYLADRTTEKVKKRCIELIYSWTKGLPHETKILEAYQMLKNQGIVKVDPTHVDKTIDPPPPPRPRNALFEDEEKSKLLARLLKSKHPEDLQAANRLIKNMVKQDAEKMEKAAKRINELETINNNVKVLEDMLKVYNAETSQSDKDMMKELYDTLEKHRPNLFRLASDADEKDSGGISDILKSNDNVMKVMGQYKRQVEGLPAENGANDSAADTLLDLTFDPSSPRKSNQSEGLDSTSGASASAPVTTNNQKNTLTELSDLFGGGMPGPAQGSQSMAQGGMAPQVPGPFSHHPQISAGLFSQAAVPSVLPQPGSTLGAAAAAPLQRRPMEDLDVLGQALLQQNLPKEPPIISCPAPQKLTLNQIQAKSQGQPQQASPWGVPLAAQPTNPMGHNPSAPAPAPLPFQQTNATSGSPSHTVNSRPEVAPLTDIMVPLETIQPSEVPSLNAYDKNGIKIVFHFAKGRPREDVTVVVVSVMSTAASPIKTLTFQAAVPKTMKVKLQPPSATDLPAYNPILPPAAITQVMLLANPQKEKVRLKFKLTYSQNDENLSDIGDVENFPTL